MKMTGCCELREISIISITEFTVKCFYFDHSSEKSKYETS